VRRREPLDAQRWVDREHAILDRRIETDDKRPERVVDRLRRQLPCLDLFGEVRDELADRVYRQLTEQRCAEGR
jgi:hypothetical protein